MLVKICKALPHVMLYAQLLLHHAIQGKVELKLVAIEIRREVWTSREGRGTSAPSPGQEKDGGHLCSCSASERSYSYSNPRS
jgi:hypothetical protein